LPAGENPPAGDDPFRFFQQIPNRNITLLPGEPILLRRKPDGTVEMVQNSGIIPTTATRREERRGVEDKKLELEVTGSQITTLGGYQMAAARTMNREADGDRRINLSGWALGLAGEAGEVADHIKKYIKHGHPLDRDRVKKELGDVLWYVAVMALELDIALEDVANANIEKLKARYPQGFSTEASLNRKE
jgi:NTP pyrophosphatase (non-canonical NTP hydrolase)